MPETRYIKAKTIGGAEEWIAASAVAGSMVYPSAGIPISNGSAWSASIVNNSANWNTAYGWGNHASAGYAPLANPAFTGNASFTGANVIVMLAGTNEANLLYKTGSTNKMDLYVASDGSYRAYSYQKTGGAADILMLDRDGYMGLGFTGALAKLAINGGLHVGGESDPGDNNLLVDGNITGAKLQTSNWSIEEDGTDLIIKRGSTILARLSNTGFLKTKSEQQVDNTI